MQPFAKTAQNIYFRPDKSTEKNIYTITNAHTTSAEKLEIESWYRLPFDMSGWGYLLACWLWAYGIINIWQAYFLALVVAIMTSLATWLFYPKKTIFFFRILLGSPIVKWYASISCAVWLSMDGSLPQALCILANLCFYHFPVGFPTVIINLIFARKYGMHPKYALLKRVYGKMFGFESSLNS